MAEQPIMMQFIPLEEEWMWVIEGEVVQSEIVHEVIGIYSN